MGSTEAVETLDVTDVAARMGVCERTARTYVRAWLDNQDTNPLLPRVTKGRTGNRGRPPFLIEVHSFQAWARRQSVAANTNAA